MSNERVHVRVPGGESRQDDRSSSSSPSEGARPKRTVDEVRVENALLKLRIADLERALRDAQTAQQIHERAAMIVEGSNAAIFSTGLDGTLLCWNAAAEKLYGFTSGMAIGRNALELVPFDRLAEHDVAVRMARDGELIILETMRRRANGSNIAVRMLYTRLADDSGKLLGISTIAYAR